MNKGKQFEQDFQKSVPKGVYCLRLTDSSPAGFGGNDNMRFSIQSPYDFILFNGQMLALELKSTKQNSISLNKEKVGEDKIITKEDLINNQFLLLQKGKKNYYVIKIV